ncbi:hypothetical protein O181_126802 [Austropuccinia psidii MF-1]|uniref:Reverse transcriptase Ty1/copia-type domain-containing protein n=1 Tax=Austropuccinia psidii MF-1 TaxID=1389203 RepID=A0A9Q3KWM9_9BASI|nr:hypothetical protein [Austropuccinia psidii MF-1]
MLITRCIDQLNVLPYSRRGNALLTTASETPSTYKSALKSKNKDQWLEAINKELPNMNHLKVWEIIDLKEDYKLIGTTWIFRLKTNHLNEITEYKARLCAQGFSQIQGSDYEKTFAPTGRLNSLRTLIAFACKNSLQFHQIDVKSAFLNADLPETVYLAIP